MRYHGDVPPEEANQLCNTGKPWNDLANHKSCFVIPASGQNLRLFVMFFEPRMNDICGLVRPIIGGRENGIVGSPIAVLPWGY